MMRPLADAGVGTPASFLRKEVRPSPSPRRDRDRCGSARSASIGAFINGKRVGDDLLTPGWTSYDKRLSFQTYHVGDLLRHGDNTIDIWLGDGWYRSQMMWPRNPIFNMLGRREIAAIAETARCRAGERCCSRPTRRWQSGLLPILKVGHLFRRDLRRAARKRCRPTGGSAGRRLRHVGRSFRTRPTAVSELDAAARSAHVGATPRAAPSTISARTSAAMSRFTVEGEARRAASSSSTPRSSTSDGSSTTPTMRIGRGAHRVRAEGRRARDATGRSSPSRASAMRA